MPEKRLARVDRPEDRIGQPEPIQLGDRVLEGPDPGQHDLRGFANLGRIPGDDGLMPDLLETLLHTAKVTHPVVNNRDHRQGILLRGWR